MPEQTPPNPPPVNSGPQPPQSPLWQRLLLGAVFIMVLVSLFGRGGERSSGAQVAYSDFKIMVNGNQVAKLVMRGDALEGELHGSKPIGPGGAQTQHFSTRIPALGDASLLPLLEAHGVTVSVEPPSSETGWSRVLLSWLPWVVFIGLYFWFMSRFSRNVIGGIGRGGELGKFLKPRGAVEVKRPDVGFDDVAGQDGAKREVAELLEYFAHPERYQRLGAEVPRGVLLLGPPGTGKTLLARALAGEAGVPFFSISASEFIEVFVGVGASRVRELFEQAKQHAPSILFIDELDSVGRVRGTGLGGGHDEREQTLNQILAEMDGFAGHEAVIVLAATNRPDVLDPALLRPGRFDRHIVLDLPDRKARTAILELHTARVPLDDDVDLDAVSAGTPGFSGADLKNLVNEAAMRAARENRDKVNKQDFDTMRDRVLMGTERSLAIQPEEQHRLAVHESGHAAVAYYLPEADPLYKVSIIPRGQALGGTQQLPEAERYTLPEGYLHDRLAVILGGRTAERSILGSVSSGADDDIRQATALARAMVARWGMSKDVGPVDLRDSEEHPFLGREIAQPRRHSEASAKVVDDAVRKLLHEAETRAEEVISGHRAAIEHLVAELEEQETLNREQVDACLGSDSPKKKEPMKVTRITSA
jgi:cell division protease FtsH